MRTKYDSYLEGKLPIGCQHCVKGSKMVLFVTGLCPRKCNFCPISDEKNQKDVVYANEWKTNDIKSIIEEAKLTDANGAGITGGDPLCRMKRTADYIQKLKKKFGKGFHIHLYTSLNLVDKNKLKKLYDSGLDEIRFHFELEDDKLWDRINMALISNYKWDVGVEIPVVPGKGREIRKIIKFLSNRRIFLNLNELEVPDNDFHTIKFKTKSYLSYAAKGSEELALKLLEYSKKLKVNTHFCTARLKDAHQLANRIKRRAKNVKRPYDKVTNEGMLIRGAIYLEETKPGFSRPPKNIRKIKQFIYKLKIIRKRLINDLNLGNNYIELDEKKLRLLTSVKNAKCVGKNLADYKGLVPTKVIEYPTRDSFEVEVEFFD